jgi:hypothetical protein
MQDMSLMGRVAMAFMPMYQAALARRKGGAASLSYEDFAHASAAIKVFGFEGAMNACGVSMSDWTEVAGQWNTTMSQNMGQYAGHHAYVAQHEAQLRGGGSPRRLQVTRTAGAAPTPQNPQMQAALHTPGATGMDAAMAQAMNNPMVAQQMAAQARDPAEPHGLCDGSSRRAARRRHHGRDERDGRLVRRRPVSRAGVAGGAQSIPGAVPERRAALDPGAERAEGMNQPPAQPRCSHCGANLSLDDLRGTNCRYCGTALPHQARAAEHAALVNQMLNQQFQARGLTPPTNPMVPYQYGTQPNWPPTGPMAPPGMMPYGADITAGVRKTAATVVVIVMVVVVILTMSLSAAMWFVLG